MSWHTSGLIIQLDTPEKSYQAFLESLEMESPVFEKKAAFDDAVSGDGVAIASIDGWTSVWGPMVIVPESVMKKLSKNSKAYAFVLEGASGSYLFEWWLNGSRKRKWFSQEGEILIDKGKPLPEEKEVFAKEEDEEQRVLLLMEKLTLPFRRISKAKYHVFMVEDELGDLLDS